MTPGARHHRILSQAFINFIFDIVSGTFDEAILCWRLAPGGWHFEGNNLRYENYLISIEIDGVSIVPEFKTTMESRYYQQKVNVPMVLVKLAAPANLITRLTF